MNLRQRRAAQAARHAEQVAALQRELADTQTRLFQLMKSDWYQSGLHDGVTIGIRQLKKWLEDSRAAAAEKIQRTADYSDEHFMRGHDFAAEWIDWAIYELTQELEGRTHAVAAGHQEASRGEGPGAGSRDRGGVPAGDPGRERQGA